MENSDTIKLYLESMQTEINAKRNYEINNRSLLNSLSKFHENKLFKRMKRDDIIAFLYSLKKAEDIDPLHKWIGSYNNYLALLTRFFRWLYNPKLEPKERPKPHVVRNIPSFKRREVSIYKPTDLWTRDDDLLFLKYCPDIRVRCYHTISRDLSARPSEILELRIKDIMFKTAGDKQYAECLLQSY